VRGNCGYSDVFRARARRPASCRAAIPGALIDVEGHAFAAYGAAPGTVVQVRPDGYVGALTRS
jgi:hypothetical protein